MNDETQQRRSSERVWPIAVLIFIPPVLTEVLMGSVTLSRLWLLIPMASVYGTAALLIREVTRRRAGGRGMLLSLGLAFAVAEECVILQTSLTPGFFPSGSFGLAYGVQWIYLTALVWYESVYAIVLPIYLTEMLFPHQRGKLWLSPRGLWITGVVFVLASIGVWQLWMHGGLQQYGANHYRVSPLYILAALVVIGLIVAGTLLPRRASSTASKAERGALHPWLVWLLACGFGLTWFLLIALPYVPGDSLGGVSPLIPIGVGVLWILLGLWVLRRITSAADWGDRQRLALIFGMSVAGMLGGTLVVLASPPLDILGKFAFDLIAVGLFIWFAARVKQREEQTRD